MKINNKIKQNFFISTINPAEPSGKRGGNRQFRDWFPRAKKETEEESFYLGYLDFGDWDAMEINTEPDGNREDRWIGMPTFFMPGRHGNEKALGHGTGTIIRQHHNPETYVMAVWAYDYEHDKNREWILKDIASKAGVLDFETRLSVDTSGVLPNFTGGTGPTWLPDLRKNCDITLTLPTKIGTDEHVGLIFRSTSNGTLFSGSAWSVNAVDAIRVVYGVNYLGTPYVTLYQTNGTLSTWVEIDSQGLPLSVKGKRIRFVVYQNFVTI